MKYGVWWIHLTGQAHHNKVCVLICLLIYPFLLQDAADREFAVIKNKLSIHLHRYSTDEESYIEVLNSSSFCQFGKQFLETPGAKSGIERHTFKDLKDEDIEAISEQVQKHVNLLF